MKMRVTKEQPSVRLPPRTVRLETPAKREGWRTKIHSPDGSTYTGDWHNSERHGVGEYISRSKHLFNGYFDHNHPDIFGVSAFGDRNNIFNIEYRGHWKNGKIHGEGVRHYRDQSVYKGNFVQSQREGYGQMWYADGSYYEGDWHEDRRQGLGFFVEPTGNRFEGYWIRNKRHGRGVYFLLHTGQYMNGVWDNDICTTSIMADIPYRQTSIKPTKYTINEVQMDDEANFVIDMIETALLNLRELPEDEIIPKPPPENIPLCK